MPEDTAMKQNVSFKLLADGSKRIVQLTIGGRCVPTPSVFVTTSRFTVPNLTPDVFARSMKAEDRVGLLGHYESLAEDGAVLAKKSPFSMSKLCGYGENEPIFFASREAPYYHGMKSEKGDVLVLQNGVDWVSLYNLSGVTNISLSQLLPEAVMNLKPAAIMAPTDHYLAKASRLKRMKKSTESTKRYLDLSVKAATTDNALCIPTVILHSENAEASDKQEFVKHEMVNRLKTTSSGEHRIIAVVCDPDSLPLFSEHKNHDVVYFARGSLSPEQIIKYHSHGFDLFETLYATDAADLGIAITVNDEGHADYMTLKDSSFFEDFAPLITEEKCGCIACHGPDKTTRSYIHHLYMSRELLGPVYLSSHNLFQYAKLVKILRNK